MNEKKNSPIKHLLNAMKIKEILIYLNNYFSQNKKIKNEKITLIILKF